MAVLLLAIHPRVCLRLSTRPETPNRRGRVRAVRLRLQPVRAIANSVLCSAAGTADIHSLARCAEEFECDSFNGFLSFLGSGSGSYESLTTLIQVLDSRQIYTPLQVLHVLKQEFFSHVLRKRIRSLH